MRWVILILALAFAMGIASDFAAVNRWELILWQVATFVWVVCALAWRYMAVDR